MVATELVKEPAVLLLDEPTSGLDSHNAHLLIDCLRDLAAKDRTTVILTIHQVRATQTLPPVSFVPESWKRSRKASFMVPMLISPHDFTPRWAPLGLSPFLVDRPP